MVFVLFNSMNFFAFFGVITLFQFFAIVERLAHIFEMEENQFSRDTSVPPADVCVEVVDADFSWGFNYSRNKNTLVGPKAKQASATCPILVPKPLIPIRQQLITNSADRNQ